MPLAGSPRLSVRLGGWCPPDGTPGVANAVSTSSWLKPTSSRHSMQLALAGGVGSGIQRSAPIMQ